MQSDVTNHRSVVLFVNNAVTELHPRVYSVFKVVNNVRNLPLLSSKFVVSFYRRPQQYSQPYNHGDVPGSAMPLLHLVHVCQLFESTVEAVASCVPQKTVSSAVAGRSVCGEHSEQRVVFRLFVKRVQYTDGSSTNELRSRATTEHDIAHSIEHLPASISRVKKVWKSL